MLDVLDAGVAVTDVSVEAANFKSFTAYLGPDFLEGSILCITQPDPTTVGYTLPPYFSSIVRPGSIASQLLLLETEPGNAARRSYPQSIITSSIDMSDPVLAGTTATSFQNAYTVHQFMLKTQKYISSSQLAAESRPYPLFRPLRTSKALTGGFAPLSQ